MPGGNGTCSPGQGGKNGISSGCASKGRGKGIGGRGSGRGVCQQDRFVETDIVTDEMRSLRQKANALKSALDSVSARIAEIEKTETIK